MIHVAVTFFKETGKLNFSDSFKTDAEIHDNSKIISEIKEKYFQAATRSFIFEATDSNGVTNQRLVVHYPSVNVVVLRKDTEKRAIMEKIQRLEKHHKCLENSTLTYNLIVKSGRYFYYEDLKEDYIPMTSETFLNSYRANILAEIEKLKKDLEEYE